MAKSDKELMELKKAIKKFRDAAWEINNLFDPINDNGYAAWNIGHDNHIGSALYHCATTSVWISYTALDELKKDVYKEENSE